MARARRRGENGLEAWPGYVDALSTLLMVIIFVLLVFVLAQAFLSVALSGRDEALEKVNRQLAEMTDMLALERSQARQLRFSVAQLRRRAESADQVNTALTAQITEAERQAAELQSQIRALTALRDELEKKAQQAAARAMSEVELKAAVAAQLADERKLGESARAQITLLNQQVEELRAQMAGVSRALELAEQAGQKKDTEIANLGQRLNVALAERVEELQRYRSEFFGRLRDVLANRPGVQVVGDRFIFQSEVLFPVGSAALTAAGQEQVTALAHTIRDVGAQIPANLAWILRVDGHADRQQFVGRSGYATNWELSAARAITVVKQLIAEGVPPEHLAATGFAENQPIDPADTPEAYAKNRRIELRLTDR